MQLREREFVFVRCCLIPRDIGYIMLWLFVFYRYTSTRHLHLLKVDRRLLGSLNVKHGWMETDGVKDYTKNTMTIIPIKIQYLTSSGRFSRN